MKNEKLVFRWNSGFILLLLLVINVLGASAQPNSINFINFTIRDGLSSSAVNAIIKDQFGFMWFGTEDGLNKFDGTNFAIYRNNISDSTSIGGNVIYSFHEDKGGNLWIGTHKTLSLYDRKRDAFINYQFTQGNAIRAVFMDHLGNLWAGGYTGLYKLNPRTGKVKHYLIDSTKTDQLSSNTILAIFEDSKKRLWIGTNKGVNLYQRNTDNFKSFRQPDVVAISKAPVRAITEDLNGQIWFGSNEGISKLLSDGKSFINYKHNASNINSLSHDWVYAIKTDKTGQLWVGTGEGLSILDPYSGRVQRIKYASGNKYGLVGKSIRSLFIDESGIYWVGSYQGGVSKYDKNLAFFNLEQSNPFNPSGLSAPIVTSFVESPSGAIYVGTDGGGLNLYDKTTGLFRHVPLGNTGNSKTLPILVMERVGNELFIGTYQHGLYILNIGTGAVRHHLKGTGADGLASNEIFCIKKDSRDNVWIGTNGSGVCVYNTKTSAFEYPTRIASGAAGITTNGYIRAIEEDRTGNMWIATNGAGIGVYNPSAGTIDVLNQFNNNLPSNSVLSLYRDHRGDMWAGTHGGGLSFFNSKNKKFRSYSENEGISNGVIHKILEDNSGKLWVSTNKGLSRFDPERGRFKNYSYDNGLQRSSFSFGSGLKTSHGELFFGGLEGFNFFDPLKLDDNKNIPVLQLTALKIGNKKVIPGEDEVIKEHVSVAKEISLAYRQNFSLDFVALNYTAPHETRYMYKLDGFDKGWNFSGNATTAVYTNLDPGTYTFRVKATSDDGSWSTPERTIKIFVKPPFWRTSYAYAFYIVFILSVVLLLRYQGIRKVKNKFALEQERMKVKQMIEEERKEADRQHEFDQLKIKFLTNLSHEFRTPISLIAGPVDKLLSQEESIEKKNQLSMVKRNTIRLLNLVNQLLDFRKLEENELKLNLTSGDIILFLREIADSFKDISEIREIKFTFSSTIDSYNTLFDRSKMERVLLNLLSNAFKFTSKQGKVELRVERTADDNLKIIVQDSGIGMSPEVQAKIFDRFFQATTSNSVLNQGNGIGLSIAKEFVRLHGGTIDVSSLPGKGSTFTVMIPCEPLAKTPEAFQILSTENSTTATAGLAIPVNGVPKSYTVLLIEDNDDFRHYLRENLIEHYRIVEASDGKEGWHKVLSSHPHVIVSDINMPYMDGITLSRKIKADKRTSHIPIILLTALSGEAYQFKGLQTGANDYLTKPFNFEILNIKIKNLIALNQTLKETYSKQLQVVPAEVKVQQSEDEKLLARVTEYIESNIDSPELSVEELSKHVFMSRGSLYSKIVDLTGETPVEFIRSIKLKKAAILLEKSDMKIAQIGYAVGFSSPNYFARAFKAKFNLSPSEYALQKKGFTSDT